MNELAKYVYLLDLDMPLSEVRESVRNLALHGLLKKGTFKGIPKELKPYQYWLCDSGNVVMIVPECLLQTK